MERVARAFADTLGLKFGHKVGAGAFKETFLVSDANGPSALKVIRPDSSIERTDREIASLKRCSHPNIAKLRSVTDFPFEGKAYRCLLEDYLAGGTLADRLKISLYSAVHLKTLGLGLLRAIEHLHGLSLVHRDIKPENVMFATPNDMSPVLVDFGLVRDLSASSITKTWVAQGPGTPLYAASEQLNNRKDLIDWRTDQFALGVTLSFAVFGRHPYWAPTDRGAECVDRVGQWEQPNTGFEQAANQSGLMALIQMARPYPIQRFRTPQMLISAWER